MFHSHFWKLSDNHRGTQLLSEASIVDVRGGKWRNLTALCYHCATDATIDETDLPPRLIRTWNHVFPHFLNQFESCFLLLITKYILSESILFQLTISHTFICVFIHEIFFTKVLGMVFAGSKTSTFHLTSVITFLIYRWGFVCPRCLVCRLMISSQSFQLCLLGCVLFGKTFPVQYYK